ncbi:alpha-L-rhamnosidase C-terminal domain-containing protein [Microbacterium sp. 2FI]|uniref:alpha-L-rhamnosidase-related protein n=1 Tax=Microbacterium sp. 2FI TaxID=2502193 RepID=UPI0010F67517|nr:alpha-L-rhamnosidase C-terminal domain-containing protein [Microbacterium sp. 2FI]
MRAEGDPHTPVPARGLDPSWTAQEDRPDARAMSQDGLENATPESRSWAWIYRRSDFEKALLARLVAQGFAANRYVHYADNFGRPAATVQFRSIERRPATVLRMRVGGPTRVFVDGFLIPMGDASADGTCTVALPASMEILIESSTAGDDAPPAFALAKAEALAHAPWEARRLPDGAWEATQVRDGHHPPHDSPPPRSVLRPRLTDGLYALDAPVLGRVEVTSPRRPSISTGESAAEAQSDPEHAETRHTMERIGPNRWRSTHDLGFRFLRVEGEDASDVSVSAMAPSIPNHGAFLCSDDILNEIWSVSADTLKLCMQGLMVDGIKRDRMPWAGDQSLSTLANAFAFGHAAIARDSIVALGEPTHGYVNGISDYSLWWLINSELYVRYFGDEAHLQRENDSIHAFMESLLTHVDEDGLFHPADQEDGFVDASSGSVFVDWGISVQPSRVFVPLQQLWLWALESAISLLGRSGHPGTANLCNLAGTVRSTLWRRGWHEASSGWREYLDGPVSTLPHAHALGVLSGATPPEHHDAAAAHLAPHRRAGTPFMTSFMLRALAVTGKEAAAVERLRLLWGDMLMAGARTFWEEFREQGDPLGMYGRPFGKSLCHAWSSGPAAMLPEFILGLRPTEDGWREFTLSPTLGDLSWAAAVIPTPQGAIFACATPSAIVLEVPAGSRAKVGGSMFAGPQRIRIPTAEVTHPREADPVLGQHD